MTTTRRTHPLARLGRHQLPVALAELDLATGQTLGLPSPGTTRVLLRHGDQVLGELRLGPDEALDPRQVLERARGLYHDALWQDVLERQPSSPFTAADVSVVICTRDRADLLDGCLDALSRCRPAPGEILVVDSASRTDAPRVVAERHGVAVHRLEMPGLDRARNLGWQRSTRPIVMYVDDDARVDHRAPAIAARTMFDPHIGVVTGLVLPAEIETDAQRRFERNRGMAKGFQRRIFDTRTAPVGMKTYEVGVGALMAFRRDVLDRIDGFDPLLDVGTRTRGAGDLDGFYRAMASGACIVYEPSFFARHQHRRSLREWGRQLVGYGYGYSAYIAKLRTTGHVTARAARAEVVRWHLQRRGAQLLRALRHRRLSDVIEILAEGYGSLHGGRAYAEERRRAVTPQPDVAGQAGTVTAPVRGGRR